MAFDPQNPGSPAGQDPAEQNAPQPDGAAPQEAAGDTGTPDGGTGDESTGQTPEQRAAEYRRKFGKTRERLSNKQAQLEAAQARIRELESGAAGRQAGSPVPPVQAPTAPTGAQGLTTAQKREAFNQGFGFDIANAEMEQKLNDRDEVQRAERARERAEATAASQAVARYPALQDSSSEFYEAVNDKLTTMLSQYHAQGMAAPPDAVLHAANDVALSGNYQVKSPAADGDQSWDALERTRAADRGTPPPTSGIPAGGPAAVRDLPEELVRINAMTRQLHNPDGTVCKNAAERRAVLDAHIERDPIAQQALEKRSEGGQS